MSTPEQTVANRINAILSTGPKTKEGKVTASQNAVKHGFFSKHVVLKSECVKDYEAFKDSLIQDLKPATPIEELLTDRIVILAWRLKRLVKVETSYFEKEDIWENVLHAKFQNSLDGFNNLSRYEISVEKSLYKNLHELQRIQAMRLGINVQLPIAVDVFDDSK